MEEDTKTFHILKFEAILFDFDGVLAESMNVKTEAFAKLFEKFGEEIVNKVVAHHIENGGISRYDKIEYYYSEYLNQQISKKEVDDIANEFSHLVVERVIRSPWIKGARDFLEKHYKTMDFYVVSGTPQKELELIIEKRKMQKYFKAVYGTPATKPEITRRIIQEKGYNKEEVLFVGDSLSDYRAAKEVNIPFLGVVSENNNSPFPEKIHTIIDFINIE